MGHGQVTCRELVLRILVAAIAALLAASPAFATPLPTAASGPSVVIQALPGAGAAGPTEVRKKKKKSSSSKESAKFEEIGNATRGKPDLEIKVKVAKSDRTCELKVKWNDDSSSSDDDEAKSDKICEFSVSVPDARDALGDATATVTVRDAAGKKVASAKKTFPVK